MKGRGLILIVVTALIMGGCRIEPPLFLRHAVATELQLETKVDVQVMWQVNWDAAWKFGWDVSMYGPLGYRLPASMRAHVYSHDASGDARSHSVYNFVGDYTTFDVFVGEHDFLFHNNDSEAVQFRSDDDLADIHAFTRDISSGLRSSSPVYTIAQKARGADTKANDEELNEPVSLQPDGLFSVFVRDYYISDNLDDYVYERGRYVLKMEHELTPATYIYLFQVTLLHNETRVIGSSGGAALTGMAGGANLMDRVAWTSTVSVPMDVYMDKAQDMLGAKVFSFGIPGCNAYDPESVAAAPSGKHYFVLNVTYVNGTYKNIRIDVTDEVRALPLGGVIPLELDVNDFPPEGGTGGGGFSALVGDWNEETGSTTIIN